MKTIIFWIAIGVFVFCFLWAMFNYFDNWDIVKSPKEQFFLNLKPTIGLIVSYLVIKFMPKD